MKDQPDSLALIEAALAGDRGALHTLVVRLAPVIQQEVARRLWQHAHRRDPREQVRDMVQQVFESLLAHGGRALRAWRPDRGLSLERFVALLAQHQVASLLRTHKTNPWHDESVEQESLDARVGRLPDLEAQVADRELLGRLLDHLRERMSPEGLMLFYRLVVFEEDVRQVSRDTGLTLDALYQRRSRYLRLASDFLAEFVKKDVTGA